MSTPLLTIGKHERTAGGSLRVRHLAILADVLSEMGYVLLPSDTAYSLAAAAIDRELQDRLNTILSRPDWPISLAFPSAFATRDWIAPSLVVDHLMEQFCPGPITIVCKASQQRSSEPFIDKTIASHDGTIGVRVPDSLVERDVAGCTGYPITTAAVREAGDGPVVTDFDRAVEIVSAGMAAFPKIRWCAIEGDIAYTQHSTVVRVTGAGRLEQLREGFIPFDRLEQSLEMLPTTAFRAR